MYTTTNQSLLSIRGSFSSWDAFDDKIKILKACSNEANIYVGPTLSNIVDATCWMMLEDVGLSLNLLKIFVQHRATSLTQQCCKMLASFEQAFISTSF